MINNISPDRQNLSPMRSEAVKLPETEDVALQQNDIVQLGSSDKSPGFFGRIIEGTKNTIDKIGDKTANFISKNITGENSKAEGAGLYKSVKHCSDYGCNHGRYAAIGAASGGALGTAWGFFSGYDSLSKDKVELNWNPRNIDDPKLEGFSHWSHETGYYTQEYSYTDSDGRAHYDDVWHSTGYDHDFSPKISYKTVGTYEVPEYEHSSKLNPLTGGLIGLLGGTMLGGAIGLAVSVIQKAIRNHKG